MIEVEIRGPLTEAEYEKLKGRLEEKGKLKERYRRELLMLIDFPGFVMDPNLRQVDIRLRNTDGFCEVMIKNKLSEGNTARRELSVALQDNTLDKARAMARAFGCKKAIRMIRQKDIYEYEGMQWELINCPPKNLKMFEAELVAESEAEIESQKARLWQQAEELGVKPLEGDAMRDYLYYLDREVNEEVEL